MVIIFAFLFILAIVMLFIFIERGDVGMNRLRNVYLYLVSFVALMMILIGLIFTVQNITDVLFPTDYYYESYPLEKEGGLTPEEQKRADENRKRNEENQRTTNKKNVGKSIAVVLVALPTFIYHWRKAEQEKKETVL